VVGDGGDGRVTYALESGLSSGVGLLGALGGACSNTKASAIALFQNSQNLLLHDAGWKLLQRTETHVSSAIDCCSAWLLLHPVPFLVSLPAIVSMLMMHKLWMCR
jgi:hypothetical protein